MVFLMGTFDLSGRRRLEQAAEGKSCVAAANTTGCANPNCDRIAVFAVDGFTTRDADERLLFGRHKNRAGLLNAKHRTLLSQSDGRMAMRGDQERKTHRSPIRYIVSEGAEITLACFRKFTRVRPKYFSYSGFCSTRSLPTRQSIRCNNAVVGGSRSPIGCPAFRIPRAPRLPQPNSNQSQLRLTLFSMRAYARCLQSKALSET
jgi:hypothetical protein